MILIVFYLAKFPCQNAKIVVKQYYSIKSS